MRETTVPVALLLSLHLALSYAGIAVPPSAAAVPCPAHLRSSVDPEGLKWARALSYFRNVSPSQICGLSVISGGLSNRNWRVDVYRHSPATPPPTPTASPYKPTVESLLLRVAGDNWSPPQFNYRYVHLIDRAVEAACARAAAAASIGPEVLDVDESKGLLLTRFVEGNTLTSSNIRAPRVLEELVRLLHRFHTEVRFPSPVIFTPLRLAENYRRIITEHFSADFEPGFLRELETLFSRTKELDRILRCMGSPTGGSRPSSHEGATKISAAFPVLAMHNDVVPSNFIHDGRRLWMLDFEYCNLGDARYDLANAVVMNDLNAASEDLLQFLYATIHAEHEMRAKIAPLPVDANRLPVPDMTRAERASQLLMKVLTNLKEGMWGITQHRVAQQMKFEASWSAHSSFDVYGRDFLRAAQRALDSEEVIQASAYAQSLCMKEEL